MSNYDMDEIERTMGKKISNVQSVEIGKDDEKLGQSTKHTYQLEIDDDQFLEIAKKAAKNDVTFNQMVNITLQKKLIDDYEYQSEHPPQLLNEG